MCVGGCCGFNWFVPGVLFRCGQWGIYRSPKDMMSEFYKTISPGKSILCVGVDGMRMQIACWDHKNKIDCGGWRHISAKG
nr:uncharacterized protein LOC109168900 [Ipomoea batatas]